MWLEKWVLTAVEGAGRRGNSGHQEASQFQSSPVELRWLSWRKSTLKSHTRSFINWVSFVLLVVSHGTQRYCLPTVGAGSRWECAFVQACTPPNRQNLTVENMSADSELWDSWLHSRTSPSSHHGVETHGFVLAEVLEPHLWHLLTECRRPGRRFGGVHFYWCERLAHNIRLSCIYFFFFPWPALISTSRLKDSTKKEKRKSLTKSQRQPKVSASRSLLIFVTLAKSLPLPFTLKRPINPCPAFFPGICED